MNIAIVLAGGTGSRMSLNQPKQFAVVKGRPIMAHTLIVFNNCPLIDEVYFVSHENYIKESQKIIEEFNLPKVKQIVKGGSTRQESVYNALQAIKAKDNDIILIHDCARPLVDEEIIKENIKACEKYDAVETAVKVVDTIIECNGEQMVQPLDREKLYQVQTPQTFRYSIIKEAQQYARDNNIHNASDDAQLVKKIGRDVHIVNGKKSNLKVTTDEDLLILNALMK